MTAAKTDRGIGKRNRVERDIVGLAANYGCEPRSKVSTDGDSVSSISDRIVHAVDATSVGHNIKREVKSSAPDKFDLSVAQLRIDADHALAKDFGAFAYSVFGFGEKCGATAE